MVPGPSDLFNDVCERVLDRYVVNVRLHLAVEVLVVVAVLLHHHGRAQHEVGEPVRGHRAVHVQLVLVLLSFVRVFSQRRRSI